MSEKNEIISAEQRKYWTNKGIEELEKIEIPQGLKDDIRASLETPQYGAYHNEGPTLASHLGKIMETINAINQGKFRFGDLGLPPGQEAVITRLVTQAIQENGSHMRVYAYLHDLKKPELMNIEIQYEEGGKTKKRQEVYTMDQYKELVQECAGDPECIDAKFKSMGVTKIGYRHSAELTGGEAKDHGETAEQSLRERAARDSEIADFLKDKDLILVGVANHEMHFQVFSNAKSALQYEKNIALKFSDEEIGFIYAVCLIDIAGSLKSDGTSDFSGLRNMVEARESYVTIQEFVVQREQEGKPLRANEVAELKNIQGLEKVQMKIELIKNPPRMSLLLEELDHIKNRLQSLGPRDYEYLGLDVSMIDTVLNALQEANYAKALGDLKLGKVAGFVRQELRNFNSIEHMEQVKKPDSEVKAKEAAERLLNVRGDGEGYDTLEVDGIGAVRAIRGNGLAFNDDARITGTYALPNKLSNEKKVRFEINVDFNGASIEPFTVTIPANTGLFEIDIDTTLVNHQIAEWLKAHKEKKIQFSQRHVVVEIAS